MKKKGFEDVTASTKFLQVFAGNNDIDVEFVPGLQVATANPSGKIKVSVPTINNLKEWSFEVHHEVSHCFPAHKYHFEANDICAGRGAFDQMVLNLFVDNLAERYQYERYRGRKQILSSGRFDLVVKYGERLFREPTNKSEELLGGLLVWDCRQRTSWMGYPFETMAAPVARFQAVCDYLDRIGLEGMMENQTCKEDLVDIVDAILKYFEEEKDDDSEDSGQDSEGDGPGQSQDPEFSARLQ